MTSKVLILGGYGNFGRRISTALVKANIPIVIAGRNEYEANQLAKELNLQYPNLSQLAIFDINVSFSEKLREIQPSVVINTCGPFQTSDYRIAETCIHQKIHYVDLADGRDFVVGISLLDKQAKDNDVLLVSGASTVPGLSSAVLEHYGNDFSEIDSLIYGISPGQRAPRGLATTKSILTYLGKPLKPIPGYTRQRYGWQNLYRQRYPELGIRWMANCDIPDLDMFAENFSIKTMQFSAGMESTMLHIGMWLTSWVIRLGLPIDLAKHAEKLLRLSHYFDSFGTTDGGMHMLINGKDHEKRMKKINWFIIAKNGDGPQIPCAPAIILAKKLITGEITNRGAFPCISMVTLDEYMHELKGFSIVQILK
jgi:hypothetical protein